MAGDPPMAPSSPVLGSKPVAGVKRPAPTLGAPFEPDLDSSPPSRPAKKQQVRRSQPAPTEESHPPRRFASQIPEPPLGLTSSPPRQASPLFGPRRPRLTRTLSTLSERAPLGALPEIVVPDSGEPIILGRSSSNSDYQLPMNRLVSRAHIKAFLDLSGEKAIMFVQCLGANGAKVSCDGHVFELCQNDMFTTQTIDADILLDIMDSRVIIKWPRGSREASDATTYTMGGPWAEDNDEEGGPRYQGPLFMGKDLSGDFSPPPSPTPGPKGNAPIIPSQFTESFVTVYEDADDVQLPDIPPPKKKSSTAKSDKEDQSSSDLSELELESEDENTKYFLSFGAEPPSDFPPISTVAAKDTPARRAPKTRRVLPKSSSSPSVQARANSLSPKKSRALAKHLSNQLAFSRVSSTPLSDIVTNLPSSILGDATISRERLIDILTSIPCVGEVRRHGKDAAGKPLESEYYYVAEKDSDEERKNAVVEGLRKPGLRSCRKVHKQYFWKRPKLH